MIHQSDSILLARVTGIFHKSVFTKFAHDVCSVLRPGGEAVGDVRQWARAARNIGAPRTAFPVFSLLFFYRCLRGRSKSIVLAHGLELQERAKGL